MPARPAGWLRLPESCQIVPMPGGFDVAALSRLLDGEHASVRRQVRDVLTAAGLGYDYSLTPDAHRERVLGWCRLLADQGLGALGYPKDCGGQDDPVAAMAAFETIATADLSLLVKYGVQFGLFGGAVGRLGTARHHEHLRRAGTLELPGCFAMTETGHGSNVRDLETVARYDAATGEFVVDTPRDGARKDYIGNAARHGRMAVVFAQLEVGGEGHGVHAVLVPIRDEQGTPCPGVRIEDCGPKLGMNGVDNGRLWFDGVRVPRENLLNRFGEVDAGGRYSSPIESPAARFFTMIGTLVAGRVSIALASLSAAKSALTIAVRYGAGRRQFGPPGEAEIPILDYPVHQRRLMPALATTYALDFALKDLMTGYAGLDEATTEDQRSYESRAAGLKALASWHANATIQECRECCGGAGYLAVNRLGTLRCDTDVFTTFEGDNTVLLQLVAKSLLTDYRAQFEDINPLALVRFLASQWFGAISEASPLASRNTDEEHLRDPEFHLTTFRWREQHQLGGLGRRLKKLLDNKVSADQAFLACQAHAVTTARSHVERIVLEQFVAGVQSCADPGLAGVLRTLCDLYALSRIEADRGWLQEHGHLAGTKSKAILRTVDRLVAEVREQAVPLVDAFGIPDAFLAAPIALEHHQA
jgi:acyl-CoA oxidase